MAKDQLININVKVDKTTKETLEEMANEAFPDVPQNLSAFCRQLFRRAIADHEQAKKRK
jgi:hypothetical protein